MRKMQAWCAILVVGLLVGADDPKKVPQTIQGTWVAVEINANGDTKKPGEGQSLKFVIDADNIVAEEDGKKEKPTPYKLSTEKNPIQIDITAKDEIKTVEITGIVEVDGDTLKLCVSKVGKDRPTDFVPKEGSEQVCVTFQRKK